jgi:hypothetical protein
MTAETTLAIIAFMIATILLLYVAIKDDKPVVIKKEERKKYILVDWPESQVLMDYEWFDKEAILADWVKCGASTYFIPEHRMKEINKIN